MPDSAALPVRVKSLGLVDYESVWQAMRDFTNSRDDHTCDEIWLVEHPPVFTQGQAGKPEHLLQSSHIPLVKTDRGGQITYHGPGQLVVYPLLNIKRLKLGVRDLVTHIEMAVVEMLTEYGVDSVTKADAPGVYVAHRKIASLGLRVRKGASYHGVAINVATDLSPFAYINPCGHVGLEMINLQDVLPEQSLSVEQIGEHYTKILCSGLHMQATFEVA